MSLVLGVDVGSQSIKAVVVDEGGDVVATGSAALTMVHQRDGWADQDPHTYCTALRDAVHAATAGVETARVVAMGLGSQVDGVVACDADGEPLRPAIIWLDNGPRRPRPTGRRDGGGTARRADRPGGRCVAQRTEDDVDPRARTHGLAACGDAGARRVVCAAPPHRLARPGRRERVVHDGEGPASPAATSTPNCVRQPAWTLQCSRRSARRRSWSGPAARCRRQLGLPTSCAVVVGTGDEHAASVGAGAIEAGVVVDVSEKSPSR